MLLLTLLQISLSARKNLTDKTIKEIRLQPYSLLFFYSPYCPHCKQIKPHWEDFANNFSSLKNLLIGEIDCIKYERLCFDYRIEQFPAFIWYNHKNHETMRLDQNEGFDYFSQFITDKLNASFITLDSEAELEKLISSPQNKRKTIFCYKHNETNEDMAQTLKIALEEEKVYELHSNETCLVAYQRNSSFPRIFEKQWNVKDLSSFVSVNAFEVISPLTRNVLDTFRDSHYPLLISVLPSRENFAETKKQLEKLNEYIHVSYSIYNPSGLISKAAHIKKNDLPSYVIYQNKKYQLYKGNKEINELIDWIKATKNENVESNEDVEELKEEHVLRNIIIMSVTIVSTILLIAKLVSRVMKKTKSEDLENLLVDSEKY